MFGRILPAGSGGGKGHFKKVHPMEREQIALRRGGVTGREMRQDREEMRRNEKKLEEMKK